MLAAWRARGRRLTGRLPRAPRLGALPGGAAPWELSRELDGLRRVEEDQQSAHPRESPRAGAAPARWRRGVRRARSSTRDARSRSLANSSKVVTPSRTRSRQRSRSVFMPAPMARDSISVGGRPFWSARADLGGAAHDLEDRPPAAIADLVAAGAALAPEEASASPLPRRDAVVGEGLRRGGLGGLAADRQIWRIRRWQVTAAREPREELRAARPSPAGP